MKLTRYCCEFTCIINAWFWLFRYLIVDRRICFLWCYSFSFFSPHFIAGFIIKELSFSHVFCWAQILRWFPFYVYETASHFRHDVLFIIPCSLVGQLLKYINWLKEGNYRLFYPVISIFYNSNILSLEVLMVKYCCFVQCFCTLLSCLMYFGFASLFILFVCLFYPIIICWFCLNVSGADLSSDFHFDFFYMYFFFVDWVRLLRTEALLFELTLLCII